MPPKRYYFPALLGKYILFSSQEMQHICDTTRSKAKKKKKKWGYVINKQLLFTSTKDTT